MTDIPFFFVALAIISLIMFFRWWQARIKLGTRTLGWGVSVERNLVRACHGDKPMVERLIQYEIDRKPKLSRTAAALTALSRLRDDSR
jgi:hypothetical protein